MTVRHVRRYAVRATGTAGLALACTGDATGPDALTGALVAYTGVAGGGPALFVGVLDGRSPRPVAIPADTAGAVERVAAPRWSRDGARLAFVAGSRGGDRLLVTTRDGGPAAETGIRSQRGWTAYDWAPDGRSVVAAVLAPSGRRDVGGQLVVADLVAGTTRVLFQQPAPETVAALRWGADGSVYYAAHTGRRVGPDTLPTPLMRLYAVDAGGRRRLVRDSLAGAVQDIAPGGDWVLALRRQFISGVPPHATADDFRELARVDVATGAATVLVDRRRLPVPLLFDDDPRETNDRIRWARLSGDGGRLVIALNTEQGQPFGTRLQHRALTLDGRDAGALPGDAAGRSGVVALYQ